MCTTPDKQRGTLESSSSPLFALEPGARVADIRQHFDTTRRDILLPNGTTLVQPRLPSLLTRLGAMPPQLTPESEEDPGAEEFAAAASDAPDIMHVPGPELTSLNLHNRIKWANQSARWQGEVLPVLLPKLALLLQETKSLRNLDGREAATPSCACDRKRHKVVIVHFSAIQDVELEVCKCTTAAVQLMRLGAFGCAPLRPSLAVDLQISPNNTAITLTLERVLENMGYQLEHQNKQHSLRRRFGNALTWYTHLASSTRHARRVVGPEIPPPPAPAPPPPPSSSAPSPARARTREQNAPSTPTPRRPRSASLASATPTPAAPMDANAGGRHRRSHPRTHSRNRHRSCAQASTYGGDGPACFANLKHDPTAEADIFPCIDTCFTQKKKKSARDPVKKHPDSLFIPEQQTARTEEYVDGVHNKEGYKHEDLLLPRSVLDGCEASFKAANEKREKASTDFFEDTALMALMCQHDRVLFPREHALCRGKAILCDCSRGDFIPSTSPTTSFCVKWGFLDRFMGRIAWVVSIFHAFGHEWACQLLYHPRKRVGFGFTNGEGAERFWNSIRHLIAHLRICGYHNRLYTLDTQIIPHQEASLFCLGDWIRRRYHHCLQKRTDATKDLRESGKPVAFLQEQWKLQVVAQTKPLPRAQSVGRGTRRPQCTSGEFREAEEALAKVQANLQRKEAALGVTKHAELQELVKSEYMRLRMNAHALKLRLRERLRARKFEKDIVERTYRRPHECSPSSSRMEKPRRGSTAPLPIPLKGLWQLEVDDVIFLDVGLDDADDNDGEPPPWLCDKQVRVGIKGMLQLDRCVTKRDARLWRETMALRVWFGEEWQLSREVIERA
ncbi:hypothetical protein B0H14DRAFT_2658723, partial [Mycena olivaceomarginata]